MNERKQNPRSRPALCCTSIEPPSLNKQATSDYAAAFNALADPTRVAILSLLANNPDPVCVCDITALLDKGQPTISHHLAILREAGLVNAGKTGIWSYYSLNRDCVAQIQTMLTTLTTATAPNSGNLIPLILASR